MVHNQKKKKKKKDFACISGKRIYELYKYINILRNVRKISNVKGIRQKKLIVDKFILEIFLHLEDITREKMKRID